MILCHDQIFFTRFCFSKKKIVWYLTSLVNVVYENVIYVQSSPYDFVCLTVWLCVAYLYRGITLM